jgi:hypothetical protein
MLCVARAYPSFRCVCLGCFGQVHATRGVQEAAVLGEERRVGLWGKCSFELASADKLVFLFLFGCARSSHFVYLSCLAVSTLKCVSKHSSRLEICEMTVNLLQRMSTPQVTAWELLTNGDRPYFAIPDDKEVITHVIAGGTLSRPDECSDSLWAILQSCWAQKPTDRPTFALLGVSLGRL